jgi:hypothetical protein
MQGKKPLSGLLTQVDFITKCDKTAPNSNLSDALNYKMISFQTPAS